MTRRVLTIFVVFVSGAMAIAPSYCQNEFSDENLMTFDGKVVAVDASKSSLTVKGTVEIVFPISTDTELFEETSSINSDIKLQDISIGDYVVVEYYCLGDESLIPSKVLKVTIPYKGAERR